MGDLLKQLSFDVQRSPWARGFVTVVAMWASFAVACGPKLERAPDRLDVALSRLLPAAAGEDFANLASLDEDLRAWARARWLALPPGEREVFVAVLERARIDGKGWDGQIRVHRGRLQLILHHDLIETELSRFLVHHELAHLLRLVAATEDASAARFHELTRRYFGIYREEILAYRQTYRFMVRHYRESDLDRLGHSITDRRLFWELVRLLRRDEASYVHRKVIENYRDDQRGMHWRRAWRRVFIR